MEKRPLVYITGPSGSGKTTTCSELRRRGLDALDTDNDNISAFYNNETGERLTVVASSEERTPEWRKKHTWKAPREVVEQLRSRDGSGPVFLCGVTANDVDEFWDVFHAVFALIVEDENELKKRVLEREEDGFGKNPHELALLLEWQKTAAQEYRKLGAIIIDASNAVDKTVDTILDHVSQSSS